ncbi:hypothetical protein EDB83DRAFT_1949246 [Lactarius deliciosus]|nr:hypothetical protein EDB83DRAFT_1949246 [Lactarius deliciosus]
MEQNGDFGPPYFCSVAGLFLSGTSLADEGYPLGAPPWLADGFLPLFARVAAVLYRGWARRNIRLVLLRLTLPLATHSSSGASSPSSLSGSPLRRRRCLGGASGELKRTRGSTVLPASRRVGSFSPPSSESGTSST